MPLRLTETLTDRLAERSRTGGAPLIGLWVCSGSPVAAEICAGSGLDVLLIDMEHSPNELGGTLAQLQVAAGYPVVPLVRVPIGDPVVIKRVLDLGAQNLLVPLVSTADQARAMVAAVRYPPLGVRGVGSALARSGRWGRVPNYVTEAHERVSLTVQVETYDAVGNAGEIAAVEGVDAVFVGPADLAASMDRLGRQNDPDVVAAVLATFEAVHAAGKPVGVNAFDPDVAQHYLDSGADFVFVGADVGLLTQGSDALAARWMPGPA